MFKLLAENVCESIGMNMFDGTVFYSNCVIINLWDKNTIKTVDIFY